MPRRVVPHVTFADIIFSYGYRDFYAVAEVVTNYSAANIPLETMWTDSRFPSIASAENLALT